MHTADHLLKISMLSIVSTLDPVGGIVHQRRKLKSIRSPSHDLQVRLHIPKNSPRSKGLDDRAREMTVEAFQLNQIWSIMSLTSRVRNDAEASLDEANTVSE